MSRKPPFFAQHPVGFEEARDRGLTRGHCYHVQDGDTSDVHADFPYLKSDYHICRLYGFDAPEISRPLNKYELAHGKEATAFVEARTLDKPVLLRSHKGTSFGRFEDEIFYQRIADDAPDLGKPSVPVAFMLGGVEWCSQAEALAIRGFRRDLERYRMEMELKG